MKKYIPLLKKLSLFSFLFAIITPVLSGCTNNDKKDIPTETQDSALNTTTDPDRTIENVIEPQDEDDDKLSINSSKCIGCGKCPRFAPDNFQMDPKTGKAFVTSQDNTDSPSVQRAISACPTDAINS